MVTKIRLPVVSMFIKEHDDDDDDDDGATI